MHWIYLILAGLLEIGWIYSLKFTNGFTRIIPIIFYGLFGFFSAFFFSKSLTIIDIGTAYAVWMGIAIIGITFSGIFFFRESVNLLKIFFILIIAFGIIGLKYISADK